MRLAVIVGFTVLSALVAQAEGLKPDWKPVPGHEGVFVDSASIVHIDTAGISYRHCVTGGAPNSCDMPPADTKADIKVDGAISKATRFYCNTPGVEVGDWHFGVVGDHEHVIPIDAVKLIVCAAK